MTQIIPSALALWGMSGARAALVAARENAVYRVTHQGRSYALRLHRQGYRTDDELRSELMWMQTVQQGGVTVPTPIVSKSGEVLHTVDGTQIDMLTWLPGAPLSTPGGPLIVDDRPQAFRALGREMARLHNISDTWQPPEEFHRCSWNAQGLLGDQPLWDRFWDNPGLTPKERDVFTTFRARAQSYLKQHETTLDCGLIHADLVTANVMIDGGHIALIDFDDGGFGFRLFEIATALAKLTAEPDFVQLQDALLSGYRSERAINADDLALFLALRAVTYVGWNITRMNETGAEGRNARFIAAAYALIERYNTQHLR